MEMLGQPVQFPPTRMTLMPLRITYTPSRMTTKSLHQTIYGCHYNTPKPESKQHTEAGRTSSRSILLPKRKRGRNPTCTSKQANGNIKLDNADTQPPEAVVEEDEPAQDHFEANIPLYSYKLRMII